MCKTILIIYWKLYKKLVRYIFQNKKNLFEEEKSIKEVVEQ